MQKLTIGFLATVAVCFACRVHAAEVPGKPANAEATTNRTDGIRLTWNAVDGASYYIVYRYGGKTAQTGLVQQKVTARNWLDTSCEAGANITYRVRAFDSLDEGGAYSAYVRGYRKVLLEPYVGGNVSVNPLANGGAAQSLKVRCNVDWTAKASDWIHLNSGSYERSNEATELGFSLEPNTTGAEREGTITVYAGQESKTLKVIQGAVEVPEYDTWCGDSALAIIEDAAFPEEFLFRSEYEGGFVSFADETATGGSCLRSSPMQVGDKSVISWQLPDKWALRFRWRKDTSNSADALRVYAGSLKSDGTPNLASATLLATCSATEWDQVEVEQGELSATAVFFVFEKLSGGTAGTASGFGSIDDFCLITSPKDITFVNPPVKYKYGDYRLKLPSDVELAVAAEVTFGHTVTYGGVEHEVKGIVYPEWTNLSGDSTLKYRRGEGEDENKTVFYAAKTVNDVHYVMMEATYSIGDVVATRVLSVEMTPTAAAALDDPGISSGDATDWDWMYDASAVNKSCVSSGVLDSGEAKSFSIRASGSGVFSFMYRLESLGLDETACYAVDGSAPIPLPETSDTDWHAVRVFVADPGPHEIAWTYAKTGSAECGSGVSIDDVSFEGSLPTSLVVNREAQTKTLADCAVTTGGCSMASLKGDWIDMSPSSEALGAMVYPLEFDIAGNDTDEVRSGRIQIVCGDSTNRITVVQSATYSDTVSDIAIEPAEEVVHVVEGEPTAFTATFTLGGMYVEGFTDLDWTHDMGNVAEIEDGVLVVEASTNNIDGSVCVQIGDRWCWQTIRAHPPVSLVAPDGMEFTADGWWVEDGFSLSAGQLEDMPYLKTDGRGGAGTVKSLTATVTGPGIFKCEGRGYHTTGFYLDGVRNGGVSGSSWSDGTLVEVPEGEHELSIQYEKAGGDYDYAEIRNITWIPVEFDDFVLRGPDAMMSGSKERFLLYKRYKDAESLYTMEVPYPIDAIGDVTVTARDSRTVDLAQIELFGMNGVDVKLPFSVQWSDVLRVSVFVSNDGGAYSAAHLIDVTPTSLGDILDNADCAFLLYNDTGDGDAVPQADRTAVGGSCLRLTSTSQWTQPTLSVRVMDSGTLSFNCRLRDSYYYAMLRVVVDDVETATYPTDSGDWTNVVVEVSGAGPHVVELAFRAGDYRPAQSLCDIDNVQWRSGGRVSTITGGVVSGPAAAGGNSYLTYNFALEGTTADGGGSILPANWPVRADAWNLEFVSGDPEALLVAYDEGYCEVMVSETVTNDSVFRVVGRYSIGGNTYSGTQTVTVSCRCPIDAAIFDSGAYDNCWLDKWSAYGWSGSFDDHSAGVSCAKSATPEVDGTAYFNMRLYGKGTLEFDWKVSCAGGDALSFSKETQGEVYASITGTGGGWQHVVVTYGDDEDLDAEGCPIEHVCVWSFAKNSAASAGENCGWVDNITWTGTTLPPIREAEVDVETSLTPGDAVPLAFSFYRYDKDWNRILATDPILPEIESIVVYCPQPLDLEEFISFRKDGSGSWTMTVDPECSVSGTFSVEAHYTLYGEDKLAHAWDVSVDASSAAPLLGMSRGAGGRSLTAMAANGSNTVGECLEAGLDPDDENAKFTTYVTLTNGVPYITWSPNLPGRTYIIMGKASLSDAEWETPTNSTHRFFKVELKTDK